VSGADQSADDRSAPSISSGLPSATGQIAPIASIALIIEAIRPLLQSRLRDLDNLACQSRLGRVLLSEEFSGGEAPGQANYVLRELGFTVVSKGEGTDFEEVSRGRGQSWSANEVELIVAERFGILTAPCSVHRCRGRRKQQGLTNRLGRLHGPAGDRGRLGLGIPDGHEPMSTAGRLVRSVCHPKDRFS
jgi:hypothetical protein